jgi:hypothetical protein
MSKAEARQHFRSLHIYWHGQGHCWDASPGGHRQVHRIQQKNDRQLKRESDQPIWREAMSEMSPDDGPVQTLGARTTGDYDGSGAAAVVADWLDRWVDIAQVAPQPLAERKPAPTVASPDIGHQSELMVTPRDVILVFLAVVLTLAAVEFLFRNSIYQRRR